MRNDHYRKEVAILIAAGVLAMAVAALGSPYRAECVKPIPAWRSTWVGNCDGAAR